MNQLTAQQYQPSSGGANAVSINIYNPQAYGADKQQAGVQQMPYGYTNSLYQLPQASAFNPQAIPSAYQQYMPVQSPIMPVQQAIVPPPQIMPESVISAPVQQPVTQEQTPIQQPVVQETVQQPQVEVAQNNQNTDVINVDALVQGLRSTDVNTKSNTINEIAQYVQSTPEIALQVVSEPIMNALIDVIKEDTTGLQGPTEEQIRIANKIANNETLTPEEEAISREYSPRDNANKNRMFALYTLAMIQKLQRDELDQYIEAQKANGQTPIPQLNLQDLIGYNEIVNVINNDTRPEVKVAAIQALQHVANPQEANVVQQVLANALNSTDEAVKNAANEAIAKFQQA